MRISDRSSDVFASDLNEMAMPGQLVPPRRRAAGEYGSAHRGREDRIIFAVQDKQRTGKRCRPQTLIGIAEQFQIGEKRLQPGGAGKRRIASTALTEFAKHHLRLLLEARDHALDDPARNCGFILRVARKAIETVRSEERRVGNEWCSTCKSRWA